MMLYELNKVIAQAVLKPSMLVQEGLIKSYVK